MNGQNFHLWLQEVRNTDFESILLVIDITSQEAFSQAISGFIFFKLHYIGNSKHNSDK